MQTLLGAARNRKEEIERWNSEYENDEFVFKRERLCEADERTYEALVNIINKIEKSEW